MEEEKISYSWESENIPQTFNLRYVLSERLCFTSWPGAAVRNTTNLMA